MFLKTKRGFTLVEIIIIIGITAIIAGITVPLMVGNKSAKGLPTAIENMTSLLQSAQQRSVSQEGGHSWGVHFENPTSGQGFFTMYYDTYSTSTRSEIYYLPIKVHTTCRTVPSLFNWGIASTKSQTRSPITG